ncbi:MAG: Tar ligand binding domain-containing protein, partial [Ferrovibrionaceae bacterium]
MQNLKILYKIVIVIAMLALLGIGTTWLSIHRMGQADDRNTVILTRDAPGLVWLARVNVTITQTAALLYQMTAQNNQADVKVTLRNLQAAQVEFNRRAELARQGLPHHAQAIDRFKAEYTRIFEATRDVQALAQIDGQEATDEATRIIDKELNPRIEALRQDVARELDQLLVELKQTADDLTAGYVSTRNMLFTILGLGVLIVGAVAFWIAQRGIAGPLQGLAKVMEVLARGDYSAEVSGRQRQDEVGLMARSVEVFKQNGIEGKRLAAEAETLKAEGWKWCETVLDQINTYALRRIYPETVPLSAEDEARLSALAEQRDDVEADYNDLDPDSAEAETLAAQIEALDA